MVTRERFEQGMTFQQYLDQMGTSKETFTKFLSEIKIRPEDKEALAKLGNKQWRQDVVGEVRSLLKA